MSGYRILALDGGGVRGLLTARVLERIVTAHPDFLSRIDLFAGSSTGAILAIGLARGVIEPDSGLTPGRFVQLYKDHARDIFHEELYHEIGDLWGLRGARYTTRDLYNTVYPYIGDIFLDDLLPRHVLVATFQLDSHNPLIPPKEPHSWKAKFFHNYAGPDSDGKQKAMDVILRSCAAPTYFPIYQGFIDGGVVANNPSMCALAQAINKQAGGKQDIDNVSLMSVGTGAKNKYISSLDGDWGMMQWRSNVTDLIMESGIGLADYQCRQLLADRYIRLTGDLHADIRIDDVHSLDTLLACAENVDISGVAAWLENSS